MNVGFEKRLLIVWLALSAITCVSLWLGSLPGRRYLAPDAAITISVIVIAFLKVRIIMREFMEVRTAPALLRRITDIWLSLTAAILLGVYSFGTAFLK